MGNSNDGALLNATGASVIIDDNVIISPDVHMWPDFTTLPDSFFMDNEITV